MNYEIIIQDLNSIVENLMKKKGGKNYELKIEGQSEIGENYMGDIIFFKIIEDNEKILNLVMKTAKRSENFRKNIPVNIVFGGEINAYSKIFPEYKKLIVEMNLKFILDFIPKIYWIIDEAPRETIIFENLQTKGFKLHDRKKVWNLKHSLLVMENYGKLHALSLVFKERKPELFKKTCKKLVNLSHVYDNMMNAKRFYKGPVERVLKLLKENGREDLCEKYKGLNEIAKGIIPNDTEKEDQIILCHLDCWNNNFMFKYEDGNETNPSQVCILDFQFMCLNSPALDLSYNIHSTCGKQNLLQIDLLLKTYHDSLSKTILMFGCNPSVFSYEKLIEHWTKYAKFGLLLSTLSLKSELLDEENFPDLMAENINLEETFTIKLNEDAQKEYDRRLLDNFICYADKFLV